MKKRVWVFIFLALFVSGCVTVRIETKIDADGSGTNTVVMAFDEETLSMLESMSGGEAASAKDFWVGFEAEVQKTLPEAKVERLKEKELEGVKIILPFKDFAEFEQSSTVGGGLQLFESVAWSEEGDTRTLRAVLTSLDSSDELGAGLSEFGMEDFDAEDLGIEYSYSIEVDGKVLAYSPKDVATLQGRKVKWDLTKVQSDRLELMVKWGPKEGPDVTFFLLIGVAVAGGLLAFVGVIMTVRGRGAEGGG